jgi:CubicO group peptidase (beta-lactamase class C family)
MTSKLTYGIWCLSLLILTETVKAQELYFPPNNSSEWARRSPEDLGWCQEKIDSLYDYLENDGSKAFILLKDGQIVLEQYFNGHDASRAWYWASAGKTLTSFMVGLAQEQGKLSIQDKSSLYLGNGWTSCTPEQEDNITIWHQLTMTSGLDDGVMNSDCTEPACLSFKAPAGTRWAYHNAPYTLLDEVITGATGSNLNVFMQQSLKGVTGMTGSFLKVGDNNVYWSTARSMARFGLLMLNRGVWNTTPVMTDTAYFNAMIRPSQTLNPSYGYLWWLNGQDKIMLPGSQIVFNSSLAPDAPDDMYCALGKNGQIVSVIPSQNMVWIRMGESPDSVPVPFLLANEIARYINDLSCVSATDLVLPEDTDIYPNPATDMLHIRHVKGEKMEYGIFNMSGNEMVSGSLADEEISISLSHWPAGTYIVRLKTSEGMSHRKLVVSR